jgi:hypothetical protein
MRAAVVLALLSVLLTACMDSERIGSGFGASPAPERNKSDTTR